MATTERRRRGPITRIKDWWEGLSFNQQLGITIGIWTLDGFLFGKTYGEYKMAKKANLMRDIAYEVGVKDGKTEAYKDVALQNMTVNK